MPKKEQAVEELAQENAVPTIKPTETAKVDLSQHGFLHIKTPLPENENIFDFLNRKGAAQNGEDFEALKTRLMVSLSISVSKARTGGWRTESWDLVYEAFYLGALKDYSPNGSLHPLEKFATYRKASDHSRHPYCGGCSNTPQNAVLALLKTLTESNLWKGTKDAEKPIFGTFEAYKEFRKKI
jgi:hypothetical protein